MKKKKVVVIGGGTGTYTVLSGLKKYPLSLSVIVSMMDSGGSNRVIRDEFGLLPTSDIRQCIVALASEKSSKLLRDLFTYRYHKGIGIEGMSFGNLFMAALTDIFKSQEKAIEATTRFLDVQGEIIPVTYDNAHLVARYGNGKQVLGEHLIDEPDEENARHKIVEIEVFPPAKANLKARKAILAADAIVIGPGDLYTSVVCNLLVEGIAQAIRKAKAKKIFVVNLMTRHGQTDGYSAKDHLKILEKYLGKGTIDFCLVNKSKNIPSQVLKRYLQEDAYPVKDDFNDGRRPKIIRENFLGNKIFERVKGDKLKRSLIRHDPDKLAKAIISLL